MTSFGPTVAAVGALCRPHGSRCADRFGRVKAVAARSAGARSASLDVTKSISDPPATKSQLLIRSPRRRARAASAARSRPSAGGLEVDDQLELGRLHDRQFRGLGALEDAAGIDADLTIRIRKAGFRSSSARRLRQIHASNRSREPRGAPPARQVEAPAVEERIGGRRRGHQAARAQALRKPHRFRGWCWRVTTWICNPDGAAAG